MSVQLLLIQKIPLVAGRTKQETTLYTDENSEVHCNTLEELWTGLRNFLRPFRGVYKKFLAAYVAVFEWTHNLKQITPEFLRNLVINTVKPT